MERGRWMRAGLGLAVLGAAAYAFKAGWRPPIEEAREALRDAVRSARKAGPVDSGAYRLDGATQHWAPGRWYYWPYPDGYVERYHYVTIREAPPPAPQSGAQTRRETAHVEVVEPFGEIAAPAVESQAPEGALGSRVGVARGRGIRHRQGGEP